MSGAPGASGVLKPLGAILLMHSVITTAGYSIPVIAPDAAADMGLAPESVGFLVSTTFFAALVSAPASGLAVERFGPVRLFQILLLMIAAGCALFTLASPVVAFAAAALIGCATGPLNPVGSHVLVRAVPAGRRPLVFSIKQCGTPAGGMIAGAVLPPIVLAYDWRIALLCIPVTAIVFTSLAPLVGDGAHRRAAGGGRGVLAAMLRSFRAVLLDAPLRRVALTGACFAACQMAAGSYLVVYLWRVVGLSLESAGLAFSTLHVAGIVSRILLGSIADRRVSADRLLALLALVMMLSLAVLAAVSAAWPLAAVFAVTVALGVSGNGWVGLFFSELARLAPPDRTAEIAGSGQSVMYGGIVAGPLVFGALLQLTGRYDLCFGLFALLALGACVMLVRFSRRRHPSGSASP